MTHIERAIEEAEAAGLKLPIGYQFVVATNARRFGQNTANEMFYIWLLSKPETWQALGKARGWKNYADLKIKLDADSSLHFLRDEWKAQWHRFIDHLAEEKDAESFFETLV